MVGYCYNKFECMSGASVLDMHAYRCKFKRHDCWTRVLVRCNCERHGKWLDAIVSVMADGRVQMSYTWILIGWNCNLHANYKNMAAGQVQL